MTKFQSADDILDFAIHQEQRAVDFYLRLAKTVDSDAAKATFKEFAAEEMKHKLKLEGVKEGKQLHTTSGSVTDLKISDYLVADEVSDELDYQGALIVAAKREQAAWKLYTDLAERTDDPETKGTFQALAKEELKHKLKFESEYDEKILGQN